jgi:hypothetical protein
MQNMLAKEKPNAESPMQTEMKTKLVSGNEALALGALGAGVMYWNPVPYVKHMS